MAAGEECGTPRLLNLGAGGRGCRSFARAFRGPTGSLLLIPSLPSPLPFRYQYSRLYCKPAAIGQVCYYGGVLALSLLRTS